MNNNGGPRPGDWVCRNCRHRNFARRNQCQQCHINRSDFMGGPPVAQSRRDVPKAQRSKTPPPTKRTFTKASSQKNSRGRYPLMRGSQSHSNLQGGSQSGVGPYRSSPNSFDPQRSSNSHNSQRSSQNSSGQPRKHRQPLDSQRRSQSSFGQQRKNRYNSGDLQNNNNVTHDTGAIAKKFGKKKREHPIGYHVLKQLLDQSPEEIVMQLQAESSGFDVMLEKPDEVDFGKMCLVLRALSRACETKFNKENLNILLTKVFQPSFIFVLMKFVLTIAVETNENSLVFEYFESLWSVLDTICHSMSSFAMNSILPLIGSCIMGIKQNSSPQLAELLIMYETTKEYMENEKKKWMLPDVLGPKTHRKRWQDDMQPPDDFRNLFIIPTVQELDDLDKPFLRRNIIDGHYDDVDHYLDVQFRLLREDFVRPLRLGIQEIKTKVKSQSRDIFIYTNVKILHTEVKYRRLMHIVQLSLPGNFKAENSKRLMFGNLVCFSCDGFQTIFFGSICERNPEMLKNGHLGVKFDCEVRNFSNKVFTMVESRSYFVAYVHVLKALQHIEEDTFPMKEFIVDVDDYIPLPDYVTEETEYDLRVIRSKNMMKDSEMHNDLFRMKQKRQLAPPQPILPLQNVQISRHLDLWPTCDDLRLDSSQRRAFKRALTSKISIIQGPPGTGKTFLGLKIAQVLLHNSEHWRDDEHSAPILVVCFTNHALDQFLEGMMSFTQSIVRIGARSKNEAIADFQINSLVRDLRSSRAMPLPLHQNKNAILMSLDKLERDLKNLKGWVQQLNKPTGVIRLDDLAAQNVIPERILNQFYRRNLDLSKYLLDPLLVSSINHSTYKPAVEAANENVAEEVDVDHWYDAEDLYAEEEDARKLDDDDYDENPTPLGASKSWLRLMHCASFKIFREESQSLEEQYKVGSVNDALLIERKMSEIQNKLKLLEYGLDVPYDKNRAKHLQKFDVTRVSLDDRWILYRHWTQKLADKLTGQLREVEKEFERNVGAFNEIRDQQYLHVMRHSSVVGMTTTGAAQYTDVLKALQPSIVIIEEAAEILEAHVVTALTPECQHLIMIGDHQQLQPSSTVYELVKHYNLGTSLFERLIKNNVAYETLEYQHRMRPNISRLLVPSIYPTLKDHESVHEHPHIRGIQKDVFFINHTKHEDKGKDDNNSKSNTHEADFIMALCRHLVLQDYDPSEITVLTPYTGQFFLLKKFQRRYPECQGVRISVVDNFQGEENDIILLSLVRSNKEGVVGFLSTENRICVALSRARHGMYIIGNMSLLQNKCDLWKQIQKDLIDGQEIGSSLVLKCENHPEIISSVSTGEDILLKSPEGGCRKPCRAPLECGHQCPKTCHIVDSEHSAVKCYEPCPLLCERNHPCPLKCWKGCEPCRVPIPKVFPCNHTHDVACSLYEEDHLCPTRVKKTLPDCSHEVSMPCHRDPSRFPCPVPCDIRLPCGHQCTFRCHVKDDPEHNEYMCYEQCPRSPNGCSQNHKCGKLCFEDCGPCLDPAKKKANCGHIVDVSCSTKVEDIICDKRCKRVLPCDHHCKRMCKDPCGGCNIKVKKPVPECQHEITVECSKPALKENCNGKCKLSLPCGHPCQARCKDPCTTDCKVPVPSEEKCPKGHAVKLPCHLLNKVKAPHSGMYCSVPCDAMLDCEHKCKGTCGRCLYGRLHIACSEKCERPLVCGHICKADCSSACPPCQAVCPMKCNHSRCSRKCGDPCEPCQEKCSISCIHQKCKNVCGEKCTQELCEKPCPKKLECGHPCVGYCGDPCPPLCRICNNEELTEILFGSEDEEDARFVLLEECGHAIEASGLKGWLEQDTHEIGMKSCPRCKKPIYNNRRFSEFILKCYGDVSGVKLQYFKKDPKKQEEDVKKLLSEMKVLNGQEVERIKRSLPRISTKTAAKKYHKISDNEMVLYTFQVQVLKAVHTQVKDNGEFAQALDPFWNFVKKRVMEQKLRIAPQMIEEITCELQRISFLPLYGTLIKRKSTYVTPPLEKIINNIKVLLDPTIKFDKEVERKVKDKLKESEKYVGGLGITTKERLEILQAMDMNQGHWFKCPNGHIYCIGECGGAMEEAKCPDCGARIGGTSHRRVSDNPLAPEMDGATHEAYSDNFDIRNFVFND